MVLSLRRKIEEEEKRGVVVVVVMMKGLLHQAMGYDLTLAGKSILSRKYLDARAAE